MSRSIEETFGGIEKRAERCGRVVQKMLGGGGTGAGVGGAAALGKGFRAAASESDKASKAIESDFAKQIKAAEKASNAEWKAFKKLNDDKIEQLNATEREQDKAQRKETKNAEREANKQTALATQAAKKVDAEHQRFASRTSQRAVRFLFPNPIGAFGMASRMGGDILRGAGVDFSMAGMAQRAVQAEALSTQLSSQGWMRGQTGANGQHVAAGVLEAEARKNAQASGYTTAQALQSQTKFVDLTGNLDDARKAMPDILKLSSATGTDPEKMAEAWANVSRHMGDIPDKAAKVEGLMRLIAGQGRVGSIEIKDEAKDLGKIAAVADQFYGDKAKIIGELTGFAQMAKAEGGAASSAQAATSIVAFKNVMSSAPRIKAMMAAGMKEEDIFHMVGTGKNRVRGQLMDPNDVIRKALVATGGDLTKFGNIFKSVMAQRATGALVAAYNSNGGRNMAAVNAKINEFGSEATLSREAVDDAAADRMKTAAVSAVAFQEKLDAVGRDMEAQLLPALQQLAPYAVQAAEGLGKLVSWAASNPMTAVSAAIAAAIGRALLESTFRSGVEAAIKAALGTGGASLVGGVVGAGGTAVAGAEAAATTAATVAGGIAIGSVAAVAAAAASLLIAGKQAVDLGKQLDVETDTGEMETIKGRFGTTTRKKTTSQWWWEGGDKVSMPDTPEQYDAKHGQTFRADQNGANGPILPGFNMTKDGTFRADRYNPDQRDPSIAQHEKGIDPDQLAAAIGGAVGRTVRGSPLQVTVTNMPPGGPGGPPAVNPSGRAPDPGQPAHYYHH